MRYEEMSDFEVDNHVSAELWKIERLARNDWSDNSKKVYAEIQVGLCVFASGQYCNNPSDAWPIIIEHRICIDWYSGDLWRSVIDNQFEAGEYRRISFCDKNPLRAAMICFLKIKNESPN